MIISIISVFIIVKVIFLHSKPMKAMFLRQLSNHEVHFLLPSMDEYRRNFSFSLCTACIALQIKNVYRWATASGGCTEYKDALTRDGNRKRADIRRRNELLVFTLWWNPLASLVTVWIESRGKWYTCSSLNDEPSKANHDSRFPWVSTVTSKWHET